MSNRRPSIWVHSTVRVSRPLAMNDKTTIEVQYQQSGNWIIHESFNDHQEDAAIAEARNLLSEVEAVRVVKEAFDPGTGIYIDSFIFKANNGKRIAAAKKIKALKRHGGSLVNGRVQRKRGGGGKNRVSFGWAFTVKLLLAMFISFLVALGLTSLASVIFSGSTVLGVHFVGTLLNNLLVFVLILTFGCGSPLIFTLMEEINIDLFFRYSGALINLYASNATDDRDSTERLRGKLEEDKAADKVQAEDEDKSKDEDKPEDENKKESEVLSPEAEKLKTYMTNFLLRSIEDGKVYKEKMDSFNKFGVCLYMAGACEILSQKGKMDLRSRSKILGDSVQVMGFKKSYAGSFAGRYEEYLMADARYMLMFQAGRNAINIYLAVESAGPQLLENALAEWNKPKPKEEQAGPVTVMFTDIAGSTAMTQSMGDAEAQQVVRAHNRIVREALSANAGKEVKHTGDGIMASFARTSDGVNATIQMQLETAKHNEANPELPLHLKIGLNAGEPIAEDNDLYGTVVQLSARIVDKASADQIYVSEVVRGICAGKDYKFNNLGGFNMRGFDEDVILYEVKWNANGDPSEGSDEVATDSTEVPSEGADEVAGDPPEVPSEGMEELAANPTEVSSEELDEVAADPNEVPSEGPDVRSMNYGGEAA